MRKENIPSWKDYLETARLEKRRADLPLMNDMYKLLHTSTLPSFFYHRIPMMYVLDYSTGKYAAASDTTRHVFGYSPKEFLDGGVHFTIENYHPQDLKLFNERIFPDRLAALKKIAPEEHANHVFTFNFRMKGKAGNYVNLIQRNCFISDLCGNPLASIGMVINVEHFDASSPVIQVLENRGAEGSSTTLVEKKIYHYHEEDRLFSKREKEILLWTADGFTSKEIASRLFISESTVINHRKSMISKAGVKNLPELVSFSVRNKII